MRLGVFGGTFDPIHNAHLFVAESARILEGLEGVLFVPTNRHHYRDKPQATAVDRCAMILGAIEGNPAFSLEEADLRDDASGYTADLLPKLAAKYPDAGFTFIIGADSLASTNWVRFDEVLQALERFAIAPRAGVQSDSLARVIAAVPPGLRERVSMLNLPEIPQSATLIRGLIAQGRTVRYLVPETVWRYITAQRLYGYQLNA
ncbi:MAG: nicotinate (nicotinamide) nucleotide adenylyltransferase [Candidatus Eremiobacteraeota bacterium]|nr:nicotinate (nicotinamide) nucleotide adenylyltransferase [Candidatus Eremiobacteraeota bacterium]